jgi:phosphohistidine phosphatase
MKRVIIVRHAKAVPYGYDDDFTRDLTDRGINDANNIGRELKKLGISPDKMFSSPANRALQTAHIFAENMDFDKNMVIEIENIYNGLTTSGFLGLIKGLPEDAKTAFFFGHNPSFQYFANNLLERFHDDMPTCSTIAIDFNVDSWKKVEARTGRKAFQLIPAMFK